MANLIQTTAISGFKVYGQQMVDYTVQGTAHQDFDKAVAVAAFAEAFAIESEAAAFSNVLRMRQGKLNELGECLAQVCKIIAEFDPDEPESDDEVTTEDQSFNQLRDRLAKYGISLNVVENSISLLGHTISWYSITRESAEKCRANTEYEMDKEDNDLQQDMVTMQGLISKRDQSFSTAAKVIKKFDSTGESIIRSIGQ